MAKIKVYKAMVDGKEQVFTVKPEGETTFLSDFPEAKFIEEIDNDSVEKMLSVKATIEIIQIKMNA